MAQSYSSEGWLLAEVRMLSWEQQGEGRALQKGLGSQEHEGTSQGKGRALQKGLGRAASSMREHHQDTPGSHS